MSGIDQCGFRYGVDVVRFTHHDYSVICASNNGWDETLRYWSLHDNSFLRYFKGHRGRVESIAMSPVNDTFLSGSVDNTVRMWDLRSNACAGIIQRRGRPSVAFDPQGLIFGATCSDNQVKLFDSRSFDKGAFATFRVAYDTQFEWGSLKFSPDGHHILLSTTCDAVFVLDSYEGELKQIFTERKNPRKAVFEASFTPDSRYVLSGGEDGSVHVWSMDGGREVTVLRGHGAPVRNVQWNPVYGSMASSCESLALWLPNLESVK